MLFPLSQAPPLFEPGTQEPYLGAAVRTLGGVDKGTARQKGISSKLFRCVYSDSALSHVRLSFRYCFHIRDKPFKAMHICMATDVDGAKLSAPSSVSSHLSHARRCNSPLLFLL